MDRAGIEVWDAMLYRKAAPHLNPLPQDGERRPEGSAMAEAQRFIVRPTPHLNPLPQDGERRPEGRAVAAEHSFIARPPPHLSPLPHRNGERRLEGAAITEARDDN